MNVKTVINDLKANNSRNSKLQILASNVHNEDLKQAFFLALDPFTNFWIKKIPAYQSTGKVTLSLKEAMDLLSVISNREKTGHEAIHHLKEILESLDPGNAFVIECIIKRDFACGVNSASVNKIWPGLIKDFPVMKCAGLDEKTKARIKYPAYAQLKSDGARCICTIQENNIELRSANGKLFEINDEELLADLNKIYRMYGKPIVLDGELLVNFDGKIQIRRIGNGIINKASKGTLSESEAKCIVFDVWDCVDYEEYFIVQKSSDGYQERFEKLKTVLSNVSSKRVTLIETHVIQAFEEGSDIAKSYMKDGLEGAIIKNFDTKWEFTRSKEQIKIKGVFQNEMVIVRVNEGTKRNSGKLGALVCQSEDGKIEVSVGSGFSDAQRIEYYSDSMIGKIVTVEYNGKIENKSGKQSLFLPTFIEVRDDKNIADMEEDFK